MQNTDVMAKGFFLVDVYPSGSIGRMHRQGRESVQKTKNEHKKVQPYLFCTFSCSVTRNTNQYSLTHIYAGYFNAHRASHNKGLGKLKLTGDFEVMVERTRSTDVLMLQYICRGRGLG